MSNFIHLYKGGIMSIAIITGASSGLGTCYVEAVTKLFPEIDEIWLLARREERLKEVASKYPNKNCVIVPVDLADMDSYKLLEEKLRKEKPEIKVLINDAGVSCGGKFENMELDSMLKMIDLNCKGATAITKTCLPYIANKGTILEVSSTSAFAPNTNLVVYSASKSYVSALCLGLREELKKREINVCAMCPGFMLTEMTKGGLTKGQEKLPIINPSVAAYKSLKAAKNGRSVYTTGAFYKFYRLLSKIIPHILLVKFVGLE